jgi:4-amino-4-deoxychorismate lyase
MPSWLVNGIPGDFVGADDRGLHYGDGLFETIAIRRGVARFLDRHLARLVHGCRRLAIEEPDTRLIEAEIDVLKGPRQKGTIKVIVTRGPGPRGYAPPENSRTTRLVGFAESEDFPGKDPPSGVSVIFCRTPASINPALAGLKTLNRLENVLARSELTSHAADEGLMCDSDLRVIGGTMSNVFMVREGMLVTPSLERSGVRGVMRSAVIDAARGAGIPVVETNISTSELARADEVFITNALTGIRPVIDCSGRPHEVGPVTRSIAGILRDCGVEETGR